MKFYDLLVMSINSLRRRPMRTSLTVLGVVIGACSIIVMLSLGIGLQERSRELVESSGSITMIRVSENTDGPERDRKRLTDEAVKELLRLPHVKAVYPILETQVVLRQGIYEASFVLLRGVPKEYLQQIPLKEGSRKAGKEKQEMQLIYGAGIIRDFVNRKTGKGFYETNKLPDVDLIKKPA